MLMVISIVGGPSSLMAQIYSHVPGAKLGTGQLEGYYEYCEELFPLQILSAAYLQLSSIFIACSQAPSISLTFGGTTYDINPVDFSIPADSAGTICVGGELAWSSR